MLAIYLAASFLLLLAAWRIFRVEARRDYLQHRRLTRRSLLLECIIWCPVFAFPYIYNPPSWPAFWRYDSSISPWLQLAGSLLIVLGIASVTLVMSYLGLRRSCGQQTDVLQVDGPYRLSRNPQVVSGTVIFLGVAMRWPSWYAVGWLGIAFAALHMMVITEEEHLKAVFGAQYDAYCRRVPRYIRLWRRKGGVAE